MGLLFPYVRFSTQCVPLASPARVVHRDVDVVRIRGALAEREPVRVPSDSRAVKLATRGSSVWQALHCGCLANQLAAFSSAQ